MMKSDDYWKLFLETGVPEYYLEFRSCKRMEKDDVSECTGPGSAGDGVRGV